MHDTINVFCSAPTRFALIQVLVDKNFICNGFSVTDHYLRINCVNYSYYSFREVKGQSFVHFDKKYLDALRLVPKEAVTEFIVEVAR